MSKENVAKFYEVLAKDEDKKQQLIDIAKENQEKGEEVKSAVDLLIAWSADMGLDFTVEDIKAYEAEQQTSKDGELSEKELEGVAGGIGICGVVIGAEADVNLKICMVLGRDLELPI